MSLITAEMRAAELESQAAFEGVVERARASARESLISQLSIRERLMRAQQQIVVETVLKDDLGEFTFKNRALTSSERKHLYEVTKKLEDNPNDAEIFAETIKEYRKILSTTNLMLSIDWNDEGICGDTLVMGFATHLLYGSMAKIADVEQQIVSFRRVRPRPNRPGAADKNRLPNTKRTRKAA